MYGQYNPPEAKGKVPDKKKGKTRGYNLAEIVCSICRGGFRELTWRWLNYG